ncbi:MAG TPA: enoyl-CoA hydratase-related protein [Acidimicrobiales bacterium]|nr:enoyl-CoA hydratase-related protein [Acidimicrobiales bacterium]
MSFIDYEVAAHVATITLADEQRRNALSEELLGQLLEAVDEADREPAVRVVVITNRGGVFCAGANLRERTPESATVRPGAGMSELFTRIRSSKKIFVGRIAGHCVAGGVGLAAVTDISVAIDTATFGFSEVRLGVVPGIISVVCLPKMRLADAQQAMLRGQRFSAEEAARIGLITCAVAGDLLDRAIDDVVTDLLAGEPAALAATKELMYSVPTLEMDEALRRMTDLSDSFFRSDQAREGVTAFFEKRPASWVKRPTEA